MIHRNARAMARSHRRQEQKRGDHGHRFDLAGLAHKDDAADPGVTPELAYGITNAAGQTWMLGRLTATEQGSFGGGW